MAVHPVYETHSTTTDNELGLCTGWRPGALSGRGRDEAVELGRRRAGVDLVVSSDLGRAVETVDLAFAGRPVERRTDRWLREVDFRALTGAAHDVVHPLRGAHLDEPFPGGESYQDVAARVGELLEEIAHDAEGRTVLLVGHAAPRYALDHLLTGRPLVRAVTAPPAVATGMGVRPPAPAAHHRGARRAGHAGRPRRPGRHLARGVHRAALRRERGAGTRSRQGAAAGAHSTGRIPVLGRPRERTDPRVLLRVHRPRRPVVDRPRDGPGAGPVAREWVGGHLEVVELAMHPVVQGRGYGAAALVDLLLAGAEQERALLCTWRRGDGRLPAPRLYERLGWTLLHEEVLPDRDLWGVRLR
jgi:broad specificity phosphatase PhoE